MCVDKVGESHVYFIVRTVNAYGPLRPLGVIVQEPFPVKSRCLHPMALVFIFSILVLVLCWTLLIKKDTISVSRSLTFKICKSSIEIEIIPFTLIHYF